MIVVENLLCKEWEELEDEVKYPGDVIDKDDKPGSSLWMSLSKIDNFMKCDLITN